MPRPNRNAAIGYVLSGCAVCAFALLLGFALVRLWNTEVETRRSVADNMLWVLARTRSAALLLDGAVARDVAGVADGDERRLRHDILLSRLSLLSQGPQERAVRELGFAQTLAAHRTALQAIGSDIDGLRPGDLATARRIHDILSPLVTDLGRAANRSMVRHWDSSGARIDAINTAVVQVIVSISAILVLGALIAIFMLRMLLAKQRAQHALRQEQELREAYRSFIDLVSHQFRNPLAVIDSSMQRIHRRSADMPSEEIARRTGRVRQAVRDLTALMDTTLSAIRLDGSQFEIRKEASDIAALVRAVVARQIELTPGRRIELSIAPDVPRELVTDPMLVEQVLANLLSNAVKYSPGGEAVVVRVGSEAGRLAISVSDSGLGIPEVDHPRVFSRFFRSDATANISGVGLGLNVARRLAEQLGGTLTFTSRLGAGSTFTLHLPLTNEPPPA